MRVNIINIRIIKVISGIEKVEFGIKGVKFKIEGIKLGIKIFDGFNNDVLLIIIVKLKEKKE